MTASRRIRFALLPLVALGLCAAVYAEDAVSPAVRDAVVLVEPAVDLASNGPGLQHALLAARSRTRFEAELLRRLQMGTVASGFFVSSSGYIVTNSHVVLSGVRARELRFSKAEWDSMRRLLTTIRDIWVTVGEGEQQRQYLAEPVLIVEEMDLAVLRVVPPPGDTTEFASLAMASSSTLRVGDPMSLLGFPEGEFRRSRGHILSLIQGYEVNEEAQFVEQTDRETGERSVIVGSASDGPVTRLQHDAPAHPGSSGGPLLDERGRVIGVSYARLLERDETGSVSRRADLNLGVTSDVLIHVLRSNGIPFTEARP